MMTFFSKVVSVQKAPPPPLPSKFRRKSRPVSKVSKYRGA